LAAHIDRVALHEMDAADFSRYMTNALETRGRWKVASGQWRQSSAIQQATEEFAKLLPNGRMTAGHHFKVIRLNEVKSIGFVWFSLQQRSTAKVCQLLDIELLESERGRGLGDLALQAVEEEVRCAGASWLELHVFAANSPARSLYKRRGYRPLSLLLGKPL
jgi:ribosomal protein S18 acetylase RimI-like enzyme